VKFLWFFVTFRRTAHTADKMGDFRTFSKISEIVPGAGGNDSRSWTILIFKPKKTCKLVKCARSDLKKWTLWLVCCHAWNLGEATGANYFFTNPKNNVRSRKLTSSSSRWCYSSLTGEKCWCTVWRYHMFRWRALWPPEDRVVLSRVIVTSRLRNTLGERGKIVYEFFFVTNPIFFCNPVTV